MQGNKLPHINKVQQIQSTKSELPPNRVHQQIPSIKKFYSNQSKNDGLKIELISPYDQRKYLLQNIKEKVRQAKQQLQLFEAELLKVRQKMKNNDLEQRIKIEEKIFQLKYQTKLIEKELKELNQEKDEQKIEKLKRKVYFNGLRMANAEKELKYIKYNQDDEIKLIEKIQRIKRFIQENQNRYLKEKFPVPPVLPPIKSNK